jgi:carbonic anhydrase
MALSHDRPATPAQARAELLAGNQRFVTGTRIHPHQDAEHRASIAAEQRPFAVVFGCSDSRLAAEIIFDRGLGDLFVVRTAGHIIGEEVLASIEFGVKVLGVPLVVVLGHDSCGAIAAAHAAVTGQRPPGQNPSAIVDRVLPSLLYTRADDSDIGALTEAHVVRTIDMITSAGSTIADAVQSEQCAVVGMTYRLADGRVSVINDHARR